MSSFHPEYMRLDKSIKGLEPTVSHYEKLVLSYKNTGDSVTLQERCSLFLIGMFIKEIHTSGVRQADLDLGAGTSQV